MSLWNSVKQFFKQSREVIAERISFIPSWLKDKPTWKDWSTEHAVQNGYKVSTWVFRCVTKKMEAISSAKWRVKVDGEYDENHPLLELLDKPNPNMSGRDLFEYLIAHLELGGNGLWHKVRVNNVPVELWPIPPDAVSPVPGDEKFIKSYEIVETNLRDYKREISAEDIVHVKYINPNDFMWGLGPLQAGARIVDTDNEAISWNKLALENRGITDGIFSIKERLTKEQFEEARERVADQYAGKENARTPWVLDSGVDFKEMGMNAKEMDYIESRKFNMYEIHALFGVDPLLTGAPDPASRSNKEEARKAFWEDTIIPILDDLQSFLNLQLASEFGDNVELEYDVSHIPALKENLESKLDNAQKLFDLGFTQEQINERLDLGFEEASDLRKPDFTEGEEEGLGLDLSSNSQKPATKNKTLSRKEYWRIIENKREDVEEDIVENIEKLFQDEADAVENLEELNEDNLVEIFEEHSEEWLEVSKEILRTVLETFGEDNIQELERQLGKSKKQMSFDAFTERVDEWIENASSYHVERILETSSEVVKKIYKEGIDEGLNNAEIGRNLRDRLLEMGGETDEDVMSRAMSITRTMTAGSSNYAQMESSRQVEDEYEIKVRKVWASSGDGRVRNSHRRLDGEEQPLDETFSNGLMYPGDISGSAEEVINCRCTTQQEVID